MSSTRRRLVTCSCPHTCGTSGRQVTQNVAKSHAEKSLRLQSQSSRPGVALTACSSTALGAQATIAVPATRSSHDALTTDVDERGSAVNSSVGQQSTFTWAGLGEPAVPSSVDLADTFSAAGAYDAGGEEFILLCQSPLRTSELAALVDHHESANAAASTSSTPLTQRVAVTLPKPSEAERRITRAYQRALEDAARDADTAPEEMADVDGGYDDGGDNDDPVSLAVPEATESNDPGNADVDEPDPFYTNVEQSNSGPDISALNPVLLTVYVTVNWLHEQWHLPRAPCHVLLHIFWLLFCFLGYPDLQRQSFVTLKAVRRALGTDVDIQLLPVCPKCRDVFPSVDAPDSCPACAEPLFRTTTRNSKRVVSDIPVVKYPYCAISAQLSAILAQPGVEEACDAWRRKARTPGVYTDVFDGHVTRGLKAPDGTLFWRNGPDCTSGPDGELRLGVMWGIDWFSHIVSNTAPSHSSCPTSFSIANLPDAQRFRTANLICTSILPGPKEQSGDEVQRFIRPIISDLLRLWRDGIIIATPSCPQGRRVRVILLALVCDKPAAHKVAGYGSHRHRFFCHYCWCKTEDMATPSSFQHEGCTPRTNARQRELGEQYRCLRTKAQREAFVKEHATRYTQLSRLPYFDLVKQVVIDPMHNLALGLVKTHFYHIWVQNGILNESKLRTLHDLISKCEVPDYLGRLPKEIGVPAGGSLTADQWLILATTMGPLTIPQLWTNVLHDGDPAAPDRRIAVARFEQQKRDAAAARVQEREQRKAEKRAAKAAARAGGVGPEPPDCADDTQGPSLPVPAPSQASKRKRAEPGGAQKPVPDIPFTMHQDDPQHFELLATVLHILLRHTLTDTGIDEAELLLRQYCTEIVSLYGTSNIRPNHHYSTHVADYARSFGPLCGFWTFLFERLNRVLKSYNTNNRGNGDIETTFFTEFLRTCSTSRIVYQLLRTPDGSITNLCASEMIKATHDERGTLAGLSQLATDLEKGDRDTKGAPFLLSRAYQRRNLPNDVYNAVLSYLRLTQPHLHVYHVLFDAPSPRSIPLSSQGVFYEHVTVRGRRYHASSYHGNLSKALVSVNVAGFATEHARVCEITHILSFQQAGSDSVFLWAYVRWLLPVDNPPQNWAATNYFQRQLWCYDQYDTSPCAPSPLIEVTSIRNHVARVPVDIEGCTAWATIGIDKTG